MAKSGSTPLKSDSTLQRSSSGNLTPFPELDSQVDDIVASVNRKLVVIRKVSIDLDNKASLSVNLGVGICIDHNIVLTTARVVGRIVNVATVGDPPLYKAYVRSVAVGDDFDKAVHLKPVAVSFASDVAVLKVVEREGQVAFPVCPVAESLPEKESILMAMSYTDGWEVSMGNVRSVGPKTIMAKAPWPLDDELPWMEHEYWRIFYHGPPPPKSVLYNCKVKLPGTVTNFNSSAWFNLYGEFVGVESWMLIDNPAADSSVGFAVPLSNIRPVIDYAKNKGPGDRVVMDNLIDSEVFCVERSNRRTVS